MEAEMSRENTYRIAYESVTRRTIHGPCGYINPLSPCMVNEICKKRFPKDYCNQTMESRDGYPNYKRRNDGRTVSVRRECNQQYTANKDRKSTRLNSSHANISY